MSYWEPPVFFQSDLGVNIPIIGFLMFFYGLMVRYFWGEHKYDKILALGGRSFEL